MTSQRTADPAATGSGQGTRRGENVLLLSSSMDTAADEACRTLTAEADSLVLVSLTESPDKRLNAITTGSDRPTQVGSVSCDTTRGAAAATGDADPEASPNVATVSSPGDLTGIGMHADRLLTRFAGTGQVALCVHSLTELLQYADTKAAFRFCHALTRTVRETGATAYVHLDPATVDDRTLRTMRSLFDRTVEF